jgi:hypothetical protein
MLALQIHEHSTYFLGRLRRASLADPTLYPLQASPPSARIPDDATTGDHVNLDVPQSRSVCSTATGITVSSQTEDVSDVYEIQHDSMQAKGNAWAAGITGNCKHVVSVLLSCSLFYFMHAPFENRDESDGVPALA